MGLFWVYLGQYGLKYVYLGISGRIWANRLSRSIWAQVSLFRPIWLPILAQIGLSGRIWANHLFGRIWVNLSYLGLFDPFWTHLG